MGHQQGHHVRADTDNGLVLQAVEPGDKMLNQQRNVFLTLAQGRQFEFHDIDAIEQILSEYAFFNLM